MIPLKDSGLLLNPNSKFGFMLPRHVDPSQNCYHIVDSAKFGKWLCKHWTDPNAEGIHRTLGDLHPVQPGVPEEKGM